MKQSGADSHGCPFLYHKGTKTQGHTFGESPGQLGRRFWAKESQREMQLANGKDSLLCQCASFHRRCCLMVFTQSKDYTYLQNIPFFKQGESLTTYLEKCLPRKYTKYFGIMPSSLFVSHPWQDPAAHPSRSPLPRWERQPKQPRLQQQNSNSPGLLQRGFLKQSQSGN